MPWNRRHLLTIEELSLAEIEQIHTTAAAFKQIPGRSVKKVPALRGKTIVNLFLEPSTRTRMAFDMAAKRPVTVRAFGEVHGVGQAKLDRYADAFLDVVKAHAG